MCLWTAVSYFPSSPHLTSPSPPEYLQPPRDLQFLVCGPMQKLCRPEAVFFGVLCWTPMGQLCLSTSGLMGPGMSQKEGEDSTQGHRDPSSLPGQQTHRAKASWAVHFCPEPPTEAETCILFLLKMAAPLSCLPKVTSGHWLSCGQKNMAERMYVAHRAHETSV
jgi:hypothetical protein